jgi:ribonuclease R
MTYTKVHEILESPNPPPGYALMRDLALILNKKRVRRGSIDFDLPEAIIEFDEFGGMIGVSRGIRNIAHRLIEEFMLAANEAVATHFAENGIPALYRIHEQPDPKRVQDFEEIAARFGASLGFGGMRATKHHMVHRTRDIKKPRRDAVIVERPDISPKHYQRLVDKISGKPEERVLSYLMLRSLKQARYSPDNEGHFALATENYLHFTSPIRRYPDLIVHRILVGEAHPSVEELRPVGDDCSFTERRAAEAERELVEWKKAKFMLDHLGDHFAGVIVSVTKYGFFVDLDNLFIEGLVAIDALPGDKYRFDEGSRRIIGSRTRRQFSIGDRLTVMVARVDALEHRIYFALPGGPSGRGKGGTGKRRG